VTGPGYLPTYNVTTTLTHPSRWRSPPSYRRRPIDYTNLHGGTHVRILTYFFQNTIHQKNFWALSEGPRGSTPAFSNSSPRATYPRILSRLSSPIYARGEAVEPNLQRHPYAPTSNVNLHNHLHPAKSPAVTTVSTQHISYFYRGFTKALPFKFFLDPFPRPQELNTAIFGSPSSRYVP